jgi:hypothetical protein
MRNFPLLWISFCTGGTLISLTYTGARSWRSDFTALHPNKAIQSTRFFQSFDIEETDFLMRYKMPTTLLHVIKYLTLRNFTHAKQPIQCQGWKQLPSASTRVTRYLHVLVLQITHTSILGRSNEAITWHLKDAEFSCHWFIKSLFIDTFSTAQDM